MSDLPTPAAVRLQRPSWRDGRLLIGVLLVLVAVVAGARVVASADDTVPVYAAAHTLMPGQRVGPGDLKSVQVRVPQLASYVDASHAIEDGSFALRQVRSGELLPASALGSGDDVHVKALSVPVEAGSADVLVPGSVVDVWINERQGGSGPTDFGKPAKSVESAVVARVPDKKGLMGASTSSIQVMVPEAQVQSIISAVDRGARVTLVPTNGSPQQESS